MDKSISANQGKFLSAIKTQQRLDMCPSTIWRLEKDGWLEGVFIFSKKYYTLDSIERFEGLALTGEFARPPRGAAAKSQKKRAEEER
jgi:hypothetical protein